MQTKKISKSLLAILLSVVLLFSVLPITVLAAETDTADTAAAAGLAGSGAPIDMDTVVKVYNWDELKAALESSGDKKIMLMQDIEDKTIDRPGSYTDQYLHYGATLGSGTKIFDFNNHNLWINMNYQTSWAWSSVKDKYEHANESLFNIKSGAALLVRGKGKMFFDGWVKADADYHMDVRNIFEVNGGMLLIDDGEFDMGHLSNKHSDSKESSFYYCVHGSSVYLRSGLVQICGGTFNGRGYAMPYGKYDDSMASNYVNLYNNHNAAILATGGVLFIYDGFFHGQDNADSIGLYSGCNAYLYSGVFDRDETREYIRIKHGDFSRWNWGRFHYDNVESILGDVYGRDVLNNGISSTIENVRDSVGRVILKPSQEIPYKSNMVSRTDGQSLTAGVGCTTSNPIMWYDTTESDLALPIKANVWNSEYFKAERSDGNGTHTLKFYAEVRNAAGTLLGTINMGTTGENLKLTRSAFSASAFKDSLKNGDLLLITLRADESWKSSNEYNFKTYTGATSAGGYGSLYVRIVPQMSGTVTCGDKLKSGDTIWYAGESYTVRTADTPTKGLYYTLQLWDDAGNKWQDAQVGVNQTFTVPKSYYNRKLRVKVVGQTYSGAIYSEGGKVYSKINQIIATITEPAAGQKCSAAGTLSAIINEEGAYKSIIQTDKVSVRWYDITSTPREFNGNFVQGNKYRAVITADLQYKISDTVRMSLNGYVQTLAATSVDNTSNDIQYSHTATFTKDFTCGGSAGTHIDEARVTVTEPKAGEAPSFTVSPSSTTQYTAELDYWYLDDSSAGYPHLASTDKFEAGKRYKVRIVVRAKTGNYFDKNSKGYINNKSANFYGSDFSGDATGSYIGIEADFVCSSGSTSTYTVGDVNLDNSVTNKDALILDRKLAKWAGYDDKIKVKTVADLNRDSGITNKDSLILNRYLAKWQGYDRYIIKVNA